MTNQTTSKEAFLHEPILHRPNANATTTVSSFPVFLLKLRDLMTSWPNTRSKPVTRLDHAGEWLVFLHIQIHIKSCFHHSCEGTVFEILKMQFLRLLRYIQQLSQQCYDLKKIPPPKRKGQSPEPSQAPFIIGFPLHLFFGGANLPSWGQIWQGLEQFLSLQDRFMTIFKPRKGMQHWLMAILLLNFSRARIWYHGWPILLLWSPLVSFPPVVSRQPTSAPLLRALALPALRKTPSWWDRNWNDMDTTFTWKRFCK